MRCCNIGVRTWNWTWNWTAWFKSWLSPLVTVWPQVSYSTSLSFTFLLYKTNSNTQLTDWCWSSKLVIYAKCLAYLIHLINVSYYYTKYKESFFFYTPAKWHSPQRVFNLVRIIRLTHKKQKESIAITTQSKRCGITIASLSLNLYRWWDAKTTW